MLQQFIDEQQTRSFAQVVGVRFEGQAPHGKGQTLQIITVAVPDAFAQKPLLLIVHLAHGLHDVQVQSHLLAHA